MVESNHELLFRQRKTAVEKTLSGIKDLAAITSDTIRSQSYLMIHHEIWASVKASWTEWGYDLGVIEEHAPWPLDYEEPN